jgi:6,7-dimethyl-8-ribityllumazine synthase
MKPVEREGSLEGAGRRFAIVVARFNAHVTELLLEGAIEGFLAHGVAPEQLEVIRVPGAFEVPGTVARVLDRGGVDGVVALGCVIRGETAHFDFVAGEAARGLAALSRERSVPVIFGVLTTETLEQALVRAGAAAGAGSGAASSTGSTAGSGALPAGSHAHPNTGFTSALAALEMANLYQELR